ncbi:MAG TPA: response regulator [Nitrososphaeraceae archaeon]|jgi:DNA-binding NtrC family response regulator
MFTKSIAIIDDDPDLLNLFTEALQMSGYNVSSFSDPNLAYQQIKENSNEYSLLIINDKMPKINALFLSTKLLEVNPKLNVILLSNFKDFKYNYKFNILKKRVSISKLINAVNESISNSLSHDDKF